MSGPSGWGSMAAVCGIAAVLATVASTAVLSFLGDSRPSVAVGSTGDASVDAELRELRQALEAMQKRLTRLEAAPQVSVDRGTTPSPRAGLPVEGLAERPRLEGAARTDPPERTEPDPSAPARPGAGKLEQLMRLRGQGTEAERLALAREILMDAEAPGRWMALQVLIELEPAEGLGQLRSWVENGEGGGPAGAGGGRWESLFQRLSRVEGVDLTVELHSLYAIGDQSVRGAAARTLAQRGDPSLMDQFVVELGQQLRSTDARERSRAIQELGRANSDSAASLLSPLLSDADAEVRLSAAEALWRIKGVDALPEIEALAQDPDEQVKRRAERMVEMMQTRQRLRDQRGADRRGN